MLLQTVMEQSLRLLFATRDLSAVRRQVEGMSVYSFTAIMQHPTQAHSAACCGARCRCSNWHLQKKSDWARTRPPEQPHANFAALEMHLHNRNYVTLCADTARRRPLRSLQRSG